MKPTALREELHPNKRSQVDDKSPGNDSKLISMETLYDAISKLRS